MNAEIQRVMASSVAFPTFARTSASHGAARDSPASSSLKLASPQLFGTKLQLFSSSVSLPRRSSSHLQQLTVCKVSKGDAAPSFTLKDQNGSNVSLSQLKDKPLVLYFYPADESPSCTEQACAFRDSYEKFKKAGAEVVGMSFNSPESHKVAHNIFENAEVLWNMWGQCTLERPRSTGRVFASAESDGGKADEARKALEQAFQGKKVAAKKWEEEIKKRELSGGEGGGAGGKGGGGGGGGWGGGGDEEDMGEYSQEPWDWEEIGQTFMATFSLILLYCFITRGPKQVLKKVKLLIRYIRQGFRLRKIPDKYLRGPEDDEDYDSDAAESQGDVAGISRAELADTTELHAQKKEMVKYKTEEDEDDDDAYQAQARSREQMAMESMLNRRQAESREKLLQRLTPRERRGQD